MKTRHTDWIQPFPDCFQTGSKSCHSNTDCIHNINLACVYFMHKSLLSSSQLRMHLGTHGPEHHIASSGCCRPRLDPNNTSPAPDAVGHAWTRTPYRQLRMLWATPVYMSDRMPNRVSNRMSKQYVRAGITRSKSNFEYVNTFIYLTTMVKFPMLLLILVVLYKYTKHMGMPRLRL